MEKVVAFYQSIDTIPARHNSAGSFGYASMTGVTNWKEDTFVSPLGKDATVKIATEAIARIGTVSFSDPATGTVNGVCEQRWTGP